MSQGVGINTKDVQSSEKEVNDAIEITEEMVGQGSKEYQDKIYFMLMFQYTHRMFQEKMESFKQFDLIKRIPDITYFRLRELGWKGSYATKSFSKGQWGLIVDGDHIGLYKEGKNIVVWHLDTSWEVFSRELDEVMSDSRLVRNLVENSRCLRMKYIERKNKAPE